MKDEELLRKCNIEVVSLCLNCHERWVTLDENKKVVCETCKLPELMEYFCRYSDVIEALNKIAD